MNSDTLSLMPLVGQAVRRKVSAHPSKASLRRRTQVYRFRNIDVSKAGAFAGCQSLEFSDGLTMIERGAASGKESIVETLRQQFQDAEKNAFIENKRIPIWLVFLDVDAVCHCRGGASGALASVFSSSQTFFTRRHEFEGYLTQNIMAMLGSSYGRLRAKVSGDGRFDITDEPSGRNINAYFHSIGKQIILFLAINEALRELLSLDLPLVVDSLMDNLDPALLFPCFRFICAMNGQRIVIARDDVVERLGAKPDYRIASDPVSGKAIIEM